MTELQRRLPLVDKCYVGDVAHAPYGSRTGSDVLARCELLVQHLCDRGAGLIIVACNTATVLCIDALRLRWPSMRFVGVEPGVKPALALSRSRRIAVMATSATVQSTRMRQLVEKFANGAHVHLQPCPGLADAIECGLLDGPELMNVLAPCCASVSAAGVDTVVLGCTHYPFVARHIQRLLGPEVTLIDTAAAVVDQAIRLWDVKASTGRPLVRVQSTAGTGAMRRLLQQCVGLEQTTAESIVI